MNDQEQHIKRKELVSDFRQELNNVSSSFCIAKWKQVTLHLGTGHTHSCHHPTSHHIPLKEIAVDVSALHNTYYKKQLREKMLNGQRPEECGYCWSIEDSDKEGNVFSDRITKSQDHWARPYLQQIANDDPYKNINPSYLAISFSNTCNFKCSYCNPEISSKWMEEIKQYGGYPTSNNYNNIEWLKSQNRIPILERELNPYIEAFWQWWPNLYPSLQVLRITGGEPLLTKNTFKVLEYVLETPNPNLELSINTNLCVPKELLQKLINLTNRILDKGNIKNLTLYTSCEAKGQKAEYIRFGLNYNEWLNNCHKVMTDIPDLKLNIMSTYNALSVTSYLDFLKEILNLKLEFSTKENPHPISLDIPYLRWPPHLSVEILTDNYRSIIEDQVTYMYHNLQQDHWPPSGGGKGFYAYEINRMERTYYVLDHRIKYLSTLHSPEKLDTNRQDFYLFIQEHDRRRGTNFNKTFPEMNEFYQICKNATLKNNS